MAFLLSEHLEGLYGGAAGGGKSDAILMGAAQFVEVPGYSALVLRRTYADLALANAIMDRSLHWWYGSGAAWSQQRHTWTFPSGATITFGYLENENDKFRYASSEFQYIAFDELTQFPQTRYEFLFSRLRKLKGVSIPLRMRAGSNPGGVGHDWVKEHFIEPWRKGELPQDRCFMPAKVRDNPHLDIEGYIQSLQHLDPVTREQLLNGDWDAAVGGRLRREWLRYYTRDGNYLVVGENRYHQDTLTNLFLTVDLAFTVKKQAKENPDWTVASAWAITPCQQLLWRGCVRFRSELPDAVTRIGEAYKRFGAGKVIVEGGGPQKGAVSVLRNHTVGGYRMNVVEFIPSTWRAQNKHANRGQWKAGQDKLDRASDMLNAAQAGRIWLPTKQAEPSFPLEEVEAEILRFTGNEEDVSHDDIWDTLSMAGIELSGKIKSKHRLRGGSFQKGVVR